MKSRGVVGKRIVRIEQARIYRDDCGDFVGMGISALVLEDGTRLEPDTMETGHGYATTFYVRSGGGGSSPAPVSRHYIARLVVQRDEARQSEQLARDAYERCERLVKEYRGLLNESRAEVERLRTVARQATASLAVSPLLARAEKAEAEVARLRGGGES